MAVQVPGTYTGMIGNLYARQNLGELYGRQKATEAEQPRENASLSDRVELSRAVPRPLSARLVEEAREVHDTLFGGKRLNAAQETAMREDRIFAAVAALMAIGVTGEEPVMPAWPGGLPVPTREELEAAYRRLSQRLDKLDDAEDADRAAGIRIELLDRARGADLLEASTRLAASASVNGTGSGMGRREGAARRSA
ncbi:MAG: hypothetical protein LBJ46_10310 [Planctomycetota bacterium]|jgi:hypothetical protein|nr:hypothetical protein [Planctomycetota bacterium]